MVRHHRFALVPVALAVLVVSAGCGPKAETVRAAGKEVRCETTTAAVVTIPQLVPATGGLEAAKTIHISTRMMGWVKRIHAEEGDLIRKGEPLLSIDATDLRAKKEQVEASIAEAKAVLANAEKMAERFEKLYQEKSVSKQKLDDVLTGRDRAAAGVKGALAMRDEVNVHLNYLEITAPVDGMIARKMIEEGNMASPGMPLLILEQVDSMKVVARVGERHVSALEVGRPVTVDVTSLQDARFEVPIATVVPTANPGSRTYDVEAYVPNPDGRLKSGMFARVEMTVGERQAVLVPTESVHHRGQLRGVFVVDQDQTARLRWVRCGHALGNDMEILSGLDGNETIVVSAEVPLVEGDRVVR